MKRNIQRLFVGIFIAVFWGGIIVLFCNSCTGIMTTTGYFQLDRYISENPQPEEKKIERIETGIGIPTGYLLIAAAEFKTGLITMKCSETFLLDEAVKLCRRYGADAFRITELREPDMISNTCYRAKIIILKRARRDPRL